MSTVSSALAALADLATRVGEDHADEIDAVAVIAVDVLRNGCKMMFCGNGGSAADAQHLATEYVVRFKRPRAPLSAIALTTDTSGLTACANDFGYEFVFERQIRALAKKGDLLFLHSTSGESENLLHAARAARELGVTTVAMLAKGGGRLRDEVDRAIVVPTDDPARAQELHLAIGHVVCDLVDRAFAEEA